MSFEWHDVADPNDPELDRLAERYHLHPLHIEDCRHRDQSAKVEEEDGYFFVVLKPIVVRPQCELDIDDLDLFLGPDYLITVREGAHATVGPILDKIRASWNGERGDQLFYRIVDAVVDSYLPVIDSFSETIDGLEDAVLETPEPATLQKIFDLKRALISLRRVLGNTRDVAGHLQRSESPLIGRDMWPFLRDVYDHVARTLDLVETHRDVLNGALDIYLSSVANRTNQVMKVLTVLGTVALPALVISGFYGMNVKDLPWADHPHAYLIVGGMMAAVTTLLLALLRWLHWF
ncbi:MAG TPA: magnesium/cobalt transporter CorA [Bryobacteraceae bacterium]|nr:magnesium/cobalt transporter CorA [Bryobacteraceae bacterium]